MKSRLWPIPLNFGQTAGSRFSFGIRAWSNLKKWSRVGSQISPRKNRIVSNSQTAPTRLDLASKFISGSESEVDERVVSAAGQPETRNEQQDTHQEQFEAQAEGLGGRLQRGGYSVLRPPGKIPDPTPGWHREN